MRNSKFLVYLPVDSVNGYSRSSDSYVVDRNSVSSIWNFGRRLHWLRKKYSSPKAFFVALDNKNKDLPDLRKFAYISLRASRLLNSDEVAEYDIVFDSLPGKDKFGYLASLLNIEDPLIRKNVVKKLELERWPIPRFSEYVRRNALSLKASKKININDLVEMYTTISAYKEFMLRNIVQEISNELMGTMTKLHTAIDELGVVLNEKIRKLQENRKYAALQKADKEVT